MTQQKFNVGDRVMTRFGEHGTISKAWEHQDDSYDWWVQIDFRFEGKDHTTRMPFKNHELMLEKDG